MRPVEQLELPLWGALKEATIAPDEAGLRQLLKVLDEFLSGLGIVMKVQ